VIQPDAMADDLGVEIGTLYTTSLQRSRSSILPPNLTFPANLTVPSCVPGGQPGCSARIR